MAAAEQRTSRRPGDGPVLSVRGLQVRYGEVRVLAGVDFDVFQGQLVALTGENGAGKSTVVRCVAGDLAPDAGEVVIGGERVRPRAARQASGLAVVWQDLALCDNLDVAANLLLGREGRRFVLSDGRSRLAARQVLASCGVRVSDARLAGSLSSGQRQLVAVARAMQSRPRLLVLDEPTASLGVHETRQVEELVARLKAAGTTILLVSHDVEQVFDLADRILVLRRGRVAADLVPAETHPDDVAAIMSGHSPEATARHQLSRLQGLVDELGSAEPSSSLPLIVSALGAALRTEQLCIHLLEERSLRCVAASGLPPALLEAFAAVPLGPGGGPMGLAAGDGRVVVDEDVDTSAAWAPFVTLAAVAGIRSSWSVPLVGPGGLIGAITGFQAHVGRPHRDQIDLVSLYAGYAAGAIERDRLFGEVTARNRVLETIREVLETLAGPEPASTGLLPALGSLRRGLRATAVELWLQPSGAPARCAARVDAAGGPAGQPTGEEAADAERALFAPRGGPVRSIGQAGEVVATALPAPGGLAALVARFGPDGPPEDAAALLGDGANSLRLALERQEAEQAHRQAAALRRSHQLQRDFLSRLSHELRTPLTAIRGYASSLLASDVTWDDESKHRFLSRIEGESARLGRLVGDLLDFSAIEAGLLRLEPDWCDLPLVLEAAVSCLPEAAAAAVRVTCAPGIGPVWADHDRLEQVFVNLLENAFVHNPPVVRVVVEVAHADEDHVAVRVADDGLGIPAELRHRLFEPQGRGAGGRTGAGLGLSIARGIVVAHGGRLSLEPAAAGATFLVLLPVESPVEGAT